MKNSFIIKNADPSFDHYYNLMRKRKNLNASNVTVTHDVFSKIQGKRPAARDGHTGILFGDWFVVFGGDRHHMPFNDCFILDIKREFIAKASSFL